MNFNVKRPCADCPFKKVGAIWLEPGRLDEILADLHVDDEINFPCHKFIGTPNAERPSCMGAVVYQFKAECLSVAARLALLFKVLKVENLKVMGSKIIEPQQSRLEGSTFERAARQRLRRRVLRRRKNFVEERSSV